MTYDMFKYLGPRKMKVSLEKQSLIQSELSCFLLSRAFKKGLSKNTAGTCPRIILKCQL